MIVDSYPLLIFFVKVIVMLNF